MPVTPLLHLPEIMTEPDSTKDKVSAKAARKAKAAAEKRLRAEELSRTRHQQLDIARQAVAGLGEQLGATRKDIERYEALKSHLTGFYEEINKLAKGRTLFEVTDLVVDQANDIVRDSKAMIQGDIYLDRVKEFVSAGDNPQYPDVLLTLRTIQQSMARFGLGIADREKRAAALLREGRTIVKALECYVNGNLLPSFTDLSERFVDGAPQGDWFKGPEYGGPRYFDFDKLDRLDLTEHLSKELKARE